MAHGHSMIMDDLGVVSVHCSCGVQVLWVARFDYPASRRLGAHRHPSHEQIFHVVDGSALFEIGGQSFSAPAGSTLWVARDSVHSMQVLSRRRVRTLDCKFRVTDPHLQAWLATVPTLAAVPGQRVRPLLERIREVAAKPGPTRQALCDALMLQLLLEMGRRDDPAEPSHDALPMIKEVGDPVADGLLQWLHHHHPMAIDGRAIARAMGYSYRHVAAACQSAFACTPVQLVQRIRVAAAQRQLLASDRQISVILQEVGFATAAHGSRVFAHIAGLSPAAWRAQQRDHIGRGSTLDPDFIDRNWIRPS